MLSGEETHSNFIVFGMTQSGLEPTIYHTPGEHAKHYITDAVIFRYMLHEQSTSICQGSFFISRSMKNTSTKL
jgi:hypothetical protein